MHRAAPEDQRATDRSGYSPRMDGARPSPRWRFAAGCIRMALAAAGALRDYMIERGEHVEGMTTSLMRQSPSNCCANAASRRSPAS